MSEIILPPVCKTLTTREDYERREAVLMKHVDNMEALCVDHFKAENYGRFAKDILDIYDPEMMTDEEKSACKLLMEFCKLKECRLRKSE